jgi:hypothetical protein
MTKNNRLRIAEIIIRLKELEDERYNLEQELLNIFEDKSEKKT